MAETIAIFDLDGTITSGDSYAAYLLFYLRRHPWRWPGSIRLPVAAALFAGGAIGHSELKEAALRAVLAGADRGEVARWSERFVAYCVTAMVRRGAVARLAQHRRAGDRLMLATASLDIYVEPLARRLGFDHTLCTHVAWTEESRISGKLDGVNLRGKEKLAAVQRALAPRGGIADVAEPYVVAYSDHHSDLPMLRWADRGVAVNPTARLSAVAVAEGMEIEDWGRQ